jgi:hypothetical protein
MKKFQELRDHYKKLKLQDGKPHLIFLKCFTDFCEYIDMSKDQIKLGVGILTGCEPYLNESWNDVREYDDDEVKFNIELSERLKDEEGK